MSATPRRTWKGKTVLQRKETPTWQPISALPMMAHMVEVGLEGVNEQYAALKAAEKQPYVLDDYTISRVLQVYTTQRDTLWICEAQLARWQQETLTETQRHEIEQLLPKLAQIKERVESVLVLAAELKKGTIDRLLSMSDEEVGRAALSGTLASPPPSLPTLTVNGSFLRTFLAAATPCCALGMVEVEGSECGLMALQPDRIIPREVTDLGFRLGHSLLGTADYEVVHFAFEFYGFETYNVLLNPGNPLVKAVLNKMVTTGDYFFFALDSSHSVTAFRSETWDAGLLHLKTNISRIEQSQTTEAQYRKAVAQFEQKPEPAGTLLHWVCQDTLAYLDLTTDRFDLTPS